MTESPVERIPSDPVDQELDRGIALCLSGGGYRAMLFHAGALWRLHDGGLLGALRRISSVSGGSIAAAVLALAWRRLVHDPAPSASLFPSEVVGPLRRLAGETLDAEAIVLGLALPGRIGDRLAAAYDEHLFHGRTLQDLPDEPRFVFNATNVQSGALWRFMKPYMSDYRVGHVDRPTVPLAQVVAASSAFPPMLSPFELRLDPRTVAPWPDSDLHRTPFTSRVLLTDGGVYDNLGLETAWKNYETILVSDGGGKMAAREEPASDWARHSYRVLELIDNQVRSLRKRQVIASYQSKPVEAHHRKGAYWGIRSNIQNFEVADALDCPFDRTMTLAELPTRLKRLDEDVQERLINWGYAVCDAALRAHVASPPIPPAAFPYPQAGV